MISTKVLFMCILRATENTQKSTYLKKNSLSAAFGYLTSIIGILLKNRHNLRHLFTHCGVWWVGWQQRVPYQYHYCLSTFLGTLSWHSPSQPALPLLLFLSLLIFSFSHFWLAWLDRLLFCCHKDITSLLWRL